MSSGTRPQSPNQLWQTHFTYLKVIGWGWFHLSTILDDFSRYIIAWKLCTTMRAEDVTDTLKLALEASDPSVYRDALNSQTKCNAEVYEEGLGVALEM